MAKELELQDLLGQKKDFYILAQAIKYLRNVGNSNIGNVNEALDNIYNILNNLPTQSQSTGVAITRLEVVPDSGAVSQTLLPNTFYRFTGTLTSLALTLNTAALVENELAAYCGKFRTGGSFTLTLDNSVSYSNGTMTFDGDSEYEFYIVDNVATFIKLNTAGTSPTSTINVVSLAIGRGTMQAANTQALNNNSVFQWLLETTVNGATVRKMIWHIGDGVFIDAQGSIIE